MKPRKDKNTTDLLKVTRKITDDNSETYGVSIPNGSNVHQTAFCVMVLIKCLVNDGLIKSKQEFFDLITKYHDDPQFDEVK